MKTFYQCISHRILFYVLCPLLLAFSLIPGRTYAQYASPVRHKILLGGAFGELRGTHFHAGIDIKPIRPGYEGDPLLSIGDGYISRVKTQRGGYGRAVYIDHPDGQRSVYGHLSSFSKDIMKVLNAYQIEKEAYEVDLYLTPDQLPIKKGQVIGTMGNAGRSFGSHLHFEVRDSKSDITLHPSDFGFKHKDTQAPTIVSIGVYGLLPDFHQRSYVNVRNFSKRDTGQIPEIIIPAWSGGISLQAYDTHNGAPNKNGYYEAKLFVDDTLYYHIKMDMISYDEGPLIKSFVDYPLRQKQNRTEALMFRLPANNTLPVKFDYKKGVFPVYGSKASKIRVEVSDYEGNTTRAYLRVKRNEEIADASLERTCDEYLKVDQNYKDLMINQLKFNISPYSFARNQYFNAKITNTFPLCIRVGDKNEALIKPIEVCIPLDQKLVNDKTVLSVKNGNSTSATVGIYKDGYYCAQLQSLDEYCLTTDTQAPTINVMTNIKKLAGVKNISASLSDNMSYRAPATTFTYKVFINDQFIPCVYRELNRRLSIPISQLSKGKHTVEIRCRDFVGNESTWKQSIVKP
jgi:hypothetical protein